MDDFIVTLHSYNVYLVILSSAITGIWGLILFFRTKSLVQSASKPNIVAGENESTDKVEVSETAASVVSMPNSELTARIKGWRRSLTVTVILSLLQGVFGIILVLMGKKPGPPGASLYYLHFVYGGIVALVIPVAVTYSSGGKNMRRDMLIYSIAALILMAAAVRAWMTGPDVFMLLP